MTNKRYFIILIVLLTLKAIVMALFIHAEWIGLGPDEAQYWTWSQQLAIGYYSKPPGIAWQIALGTFLFGNTELGVRFFSIVIAFLLPIAVYKLARHCRLTSATSFWAALIMAFSPLGILSSFLAITDGGLVLFWTLCTVVVCKALNEDKKLPFYQIGGLILLGALFKWPIYLFWIYVIAVVCLRRQLFSKHFFGGFVLSLMGLLPSLIWNSQHDYATFKHVFFTVYGKNTIDVGATALLKGNFLEFFAAQALLLSPILFFCFLVAIVAFIKNRKTLNSSLFFCGASSLSLLLIFAIYSVFKKMQGNWCDFALPGAAVMTAWYICEKAKKGFIWIPVGIITSIALVIILFSFPQPFKHNLGWKSLKEILITEGYNPDDNFLFADKYQMTSLLSFYGPEQKRAYFLNLQNFRRNQFSYWPGMEMEQLGKNGYFVVVERTPSSEKERNTLVQRYETELTPYFKDVHFKGEHTLVTWKNKPLRSAFIFSGTSFNGKLPEANISY